jgi:hypothetical protein
MEFDLAFAAAQELVGHLPEGYSHTAELFDACLKWAPTRTRKIAEVETHMVRFRGLSFTVEQSPAVIKGRDGKSKILMPGKIEHDVCHAVRKLAGDDLDRWQVQVNNTYVEMQAGFSIYDIRCVLAAEGSNYKSSEIEEAMHVLVGSKIKITAENGDSVGGVVSGVFQTLVYSKRRNKAIANNDGADRNFRGWAKLHPLVTQAVLNRTYRRVNFTLMMSFNNGFARWFYERLCNVYIQAGTDAWYDSRKRYHISLDTIEREGPFKIQPTTRRRDTLRHIRKGMEELKKADVVFKYEERVQRVLQPGQRGVGDISNIVWEISPGRRFAEDVTKENEARKAKRVCG